MTESSEKKIEDRITLLERRIDELMRLIEEHLEQYLDEDLKARGLK